MAVTKHGIPLHRYLGASSDTKPTKATHDTPIGATFYEYDTGILFITHDGTNWVAKDHGTSIFGKPTLMARGNGTATWSRGQHQKSTTGWTANLKGGVQSAWNDWAAVYVPVNELPLTRLSSALWTWLNTEEEAMGVNMVVWVHDPTDNNKRAEITQDATAASLEKTAGQIAHELSLTTDYFYFYGEGTTGTGLTAAPPNYYGLDDFQADAIFSTWTIYRISFEWGWHAGDIDFKDVWVEDIKLNEIVIPLGPATGTHRKTVIATKLMLATAKTTDEVISESTGAGTDWDFAFGGTGYITKAVITHDADITPRLSLLLFSAPPTGMKNDEGANSNPLTADVPYYLGRIDFPAMSYNGTGDASALATPSTYGNLPLAFDAPTIYGVLLQNDATSTFAAEDLTIALTADMEDN